MSNESTQLQPKWDDGLFKDAIKEWSPDADVKVIAVLSGGYSGAAVLLIDIEQNKKNTDLPLGMIRSGQYVLKLDTNRPREGSDADEGQRHTMASEWGGDFALRHLPVLVKHHRSEEHVVFLYEIAGKGFTRLARSDLIHIGPLEIRLRELAETLLAKFNKKATISRDQTIGSLMNEWLSWRIHPEQAPALYLLAESLSGRGRAFVQSLHILANPIKLAEDIFSNNKVNVAFRGMLHGDLHQENVLWDKSSDSPHFWLIDFAFARIGPLFFDHAYFELSLLLKHFEGIDPARMLTLLDTFQHTAGQLGGRFLAPTDEGIRLLTAAFRLGINNWQKIEQDLRADAVAEQWALARVAAGLNWANKQIDKDARKLAFCYAAHACTEYLKQFHEEDWNEWSKDAETRLIEGSQNRPHSENDRSWRVFWDEMSAFSASDFFVLIAGPLGNSDSLASLGQLPWSAVVDFDANSDIDGLLRLARGNIEQTRGFHLFGKTVPSINLTRGVAWMMAGGSKSLEEKIPSTVAEWRPLYKQSLRMLAAELRKQSAPATVRILIIPGKAAANDLLVRALEELVDELASDRRVIVASDGPNAERWNIPEVTKQIHIPTEELCRRVGTIFGLSSNSETAMVPGVTGPVAVELKNIRNFEEDFEILHSAVLTKDYTAEDDAFWRGGPPTWKDLESHSPVQRDIDKKLASEIRGKLKENRTSKLEFLHTPGAGGSTVSLTAAWAVRHQYPTVVLRRKSKSTADRTGWLFHLTGLPVLIIADALLTTTEVTELIHTLSNRNVRAVVVHVQRVSHRIDGKLGVYDPMEPHEAQTFAQLFGRRTADHERAALLHSLGDPSNAELSHLRSPFFFGLITYEKTFTHISNYVSHHLVQATYSEGKLLGYLALVSRFSQIAVSSSLARRLINLPPSSNKPIGSIIGPDAARLIVEWDKLVKLVHPLISEEILIQQGGGHGKWKLGLSDLCIDFARQSLLAAGDYTTELEQLFRNLFIERENWSIDEPVGGRSQFSPLLIAIPSDAGRARLLETLTELCPLDPHFWHHRGRLSAYSDSPNYTQAEAFLLRAIELSGGTDPLHHHALGMVRRFALHAKVREISALATARNTKLSAESLFNQIQPLVGASLAAFSETRYINPDDAHGYVTAVQTILFIAEELSKTTGEGFQSLCKESGPVGDWIREQISSAEGLLAQLARIRGNEGESSYEIVCLTKLAKLYGSFELIKSWEGMLEKTTEPEHMRRAIVSLYLARRQRRWSSIEPKELRRITKLSEDNLRSDPSDERDLRSWFHAMRRLPEFNYYEAIERLQAWAASGKSLDAFYYQYILLFLRWHSQGDDAEELILKNIEKCIQMQSGQRGFSYEWLSLSPKWCPLINAHDMGEWDRQRNFFTNTSPLAFHKGTIESIKPQAGTIRLGRLLRAFFVPPTDIREASHINAEVHFYLGFSYEGFRAWGVKLGPAPIADEASRSKETTQPRVPHKLWAGGIPFHFKESDIRSLFEPFGKVDVVELPLSFSHSGNNRGFAFIVMRSKAEAQKAIDKLNGHVTLLGRRLQVRDADRGL